MPGPRPPMRNFKAGAKQEKLTKELKVVQVGLRAPSRRGEHVRGISGDGGSLEGNVLAKKGVSEQVRHIRSCVLGRSQAARG